MISIVKQLKHDLKKFNIQKQSIQTLFIGGGTPSCVDAFLYEEFFKNIKPFLDPSCEITTEANPNSLSSNWIEIMKDFGVNRVSVGVQSFDDKKLKFLGRSHSKDIAIKSIKSLHDKKIKNISLDLIYNTSLDTRELLENDLNIAFSLPINHLSCYSLTIEKDTIFFNNQKAFNENEKLSFWLINEIQKRGFNQYEISNFGKYKCLHNLGYWRYNEYLGIGCSSVGRVKNKRYYPLHDIEQYIKDPTYKRVELLSENDIKTEKILLGLRSIVGINKNILNQIEQKRANDLVSENRLIYKDSFFYNRDYFLSDEIALYLLRDN